MDNQYKVAVYYFPNYHEDERNKKWHGEGWTEWELVKAAKPRFLGHGQPKIPLWGYEDEADPNVMEKKINVAADNGITSFIFDWYWYEDGPFLQKCLDEGFLKAKNNHRLNFSLMWANHHWVDIHPAGRIKPYNTLASGFVTEEAFYKATQHIINNYFNHPSYLKLDGKLYFSIYELMSLVKGLGGLEKTAKVLKDFRQRVKAAGLEELHMNAVVWGVQILPEETKITNPNEMLDFLGFDSVTSYVWIHNVELNQFPQTEYAWCAEQAKKDYIKFENEYQLPYYPNVTMGWDSSPRTIQTEKFDLLGYPYMPILSDNTPQEFEKVLINVKNYLDTTNLPTKMFTINAWNEWTEGSYLEPDTINEYQYLEKIKKVFG